MLKINLEKHLNFDNKIYIAFSGGSDSSALLYLISDLRDRYEFNLEAIHINHNLSDDSKKWEDHCKTICKNLSVPIIVRSVEIKPSGDGLESAARKSRYSEFESILQKDDQLLMAHHADDVAETFFLRLFRGTGSDGLGGPKIRRSVGKGTLIRPLLDSSKKELLDFIKQRDIKFINDLSNFEVNQDRNFIRNNLMPLIGERWSNVSSRISNASKLLQERNKTFSDLFISKYKNLIGPKIPIKELKKLDSLTAIDIIRYSIKEQGIAYPNKKVSQEIIKVFLLSSPGPNAEVSWSRADMDQPGGRLCKKDGHIIILKR
ncbi:MAG: tRNA lysidine(34) synthetase TilS [SAR86 cluster bacterium]|nr:tRNA lysidine(34) synthetase TilS [SAR86 cluster bacterium]